MLCHGCHGTNSPDICKDCDRKQERYEQAESDALDKITALGYKYCYQPPPIPIRSMDCQFWHDDYDGAPDSGDNRCGFGRDYQECLEKILEIQEDWE